MICGRERADVVVAGVMGKFMVVVVVCVGCAVVILHAVESKIDLWSLNRKGFTLVLHAI